MPTDVAKAPVVHAPVIAMDTLPIPDAQTVIADNNQLVTSIIWWSQFVPLLCCVCTFCPTRLRVAPVPVAVLVARVAISTLLTTALGATP